MSVMPPALPAYQDDRLIEEFRIGARDVVLDIGGGAVPFRRADVVVDLHVHDNRHRGGKDLVVPKGARYLQADIEALPFRDKVFDFVICRHALEHVRDPAKACGEIIRVARRGFLETPSPMGECLHGYPSHRWLVGNEDGALVFRRRPFLRHPSRHATRSLYYKDPYFRVFFEEAGRLFFCTQRYWEGAFPFRVEAAGETAFNYDDRVQAAVSHLDYALDCMGFDEDAHVEADVLENLHAALQLHPSHGLLVKLVELYRDRTRYSRDQFLDFVQALKKADLLLLLASGMSSDPSKAEWFFSELLQKVSWEGAIPDHETPRARGRAPLISVVVRTLNRGPLLRECLKSLQAQTFPDFEVVVVNDGGKDVSGILGLFKDRLDLLSVHHGRNRGRAAALNSALGIARGRYLAFLDDDDLYYPNHLQVLAEAVLDGGCRIAYSACKRTIYLPKDGKLVPQREETVFQPYDRKKLTVFNYIPNLALLAEAALVREAGGVDDSLDTNEDWDLLIRLAQRRPMKAVGTLTAEYRQIHGSSCSLTMREDFLRTLKRIYEKYPAEDHQVRLDRRAYLRELLREGARGETVEGRTETPYVLGHAR